MKKELITKVKEKVILKKKEEHFDSESHKYTIIYEWNGYFLNLPKEIEITVEREVHDLYEIIKLNNIKKEDLLKLIKKTL
jgi:hypothetical protein